MIEYALLFALGFLTAALLGLLVAPVIQRRIVYFAENRLRATMPISPQDVRAQKDAVRAEHAAEAARLSASVRRERERATAEMLKTAEMAKVLFEAHERQALLEAEIAGLKTTIETLETALDTAHREIETLRPPEEPKEGDLEDMVDPADAYMPDDEPQPDDEGQRLRQEARARAEMLRRQAETSLLNTGDPSSPGQAPPSAGAAGDIDKFADLKERLNAFAPLRLPAARPHQASGADDQTAMTTAVRPPEALPARSISAPSTEEIDAFVARLMASKPADDETLRLDLAALAARSVAATAEQEGDASPIPALIARDMERQRQDRQSLGDRIKALGASSDRPRST